MENTRIKELETLIRRYQKSYYDGEGEISDGEFDRLWDELKELDPENEVLKKIGADNIGFEKAVHIMPMGSQEKAADPDAFAVWAGKQPFDEFLVEYKLDGASIELQYEDGIFVRAVTRGDGTVGDNITRNASRMQGLVRELCISRKQGDLFDGAERFRLSGGVRGEVIMTHEIHDKYYRDKANCRNAANGLMKRKDGTGSEHLEIICYDAYFDPQRNPGIPLPFADEEEKIKWLSACGFHTVPLHICHGSDDVTAYRARVMEMRSSLPYDIDGLVVKGREIDMDDLRRARPEKQIAFKFSLEEAVSVLRSVEWSETGATYTPIGIVDPVQLAGTTVQRANLNNPNMIASLDLKIGSHVVVTKRGEIIPKIEYLGENPPDVQDIVQPAVCSTCGTELTDEGTRLYCPNTACPKRILHRLEKWIDVLDVKDFGVNLIRRLFESGRIKSISDLYTLTEDELAALDRMGEKSAAKVLRSLNGRRTLSVAAFVAGFDIEGIGETLVEKLSDAGFDTLEKLFGASDEQIAAVNGFGDITARVLTQGLAENRDEMERLVGFGTITLMAPSSGGILYGKSFCFTGELRTVKRAEAESLVKKLGGTAKSSVVKGLSYLVTNNPDSGSSKNKKARELGVEIIDEDRFLEMVK